MRAWLTSPRTTSPVVVASAPWTLRKLALPRGCPSDGLSTSAAFLPATPSNACASITTLSGNEAKVHSTLFPTVGLSIVPGKRAQPLRTGALPLVALALTWPTRTMLIALTRVSAQIAPVLCAFKTYAVPAMIKANTAAGSNA